MLRIQGIVLAIAAVCCSVSFAAPPEVVVKEKVVEARNHSTIRASDLLNLDLVLENGTSMGVAKDLVIDNGSGQIEYVVVAADNGEYRAIPWKTLAIYQGDNVKDRYFVLGMEQERFLKAPAIPQKEFQTYSTWSTYAPQVNKYYTDVRPIKPGAVRRAERRIERVR